MHAVEIIDWLAMLFEREVFGAGLDELANSLADGSMKQTNTDRGCVALSSWFCDRHMLVNSTWDREMLLQNRTF